MRSTAHAFIAATVIMCFAGVARAADNDSTEADRIFGVLPNYTTVDGGPQGALAPAARQTTRESFKVASLGTFDPVIYPFIGVMTAVGSGSSAATYRERYAVAFADNAIGNFMTTAVVPSLTNEDSRYYRRGEGGV